MQTSVKMRLDKACAGQISDCAPVRVRTLAAETGAIPFGCGIVLGTDKTQQCKLPTANTQKFGGIAVKTHAIESVSGSAAPSYPVLSAVNVMTDGGIWVWVKDSDTAAIEDTLFMVPSGADAGKFTNVSTNNIATGLKVRSLSSETTPVARLIAEVVFTDPV